MAVIVDNEHYGSRSVLTVWRGVAYLKRMKTDAMSDSAVLVEIGRRLQATRLNANLAQADVARKAGVSRRTLQKMERGQACTLLVLIRVLRAMGVPDVMAGFLPEPGMSPIQLAKLKGRERQRASRQQGRKQV